jgi:hypothetical protein
MTDIDTNIAEFNITIDNIEEAFNLQEKRKMRWGKFLLKYLKLRH